MTWLAEDRAGLAVERILDATGRLVAEHGPSGLSMDAVAREAGCSRATLYRHVDNRHALLTAYAHREARRIVERVAERVPRGAPRAARMTEAVLGCLAEVRAHPHLRAWYGAGDAGVLAEILQESPLIEAFTARFVVGRAGDRDVAPDRDLARWLLRAMLSLLAVPGDDEAEERRLVERFLAPHLAPADRPALSD